MSESIEYNNEFIELIKAIRFNEPLKPSYHISNSEQKSFETPFKYTNGKPICVGDIVKISYESDKDREYSQKTDNGTFIIKFDGACETKDGYYLWDGEYSKRFDGRETIEKVSNIYAHHIAFEEFAPKNTINENLIKDISQHKSNREVFYDKNICLMWKYDNSKFKLFHNEIDEFIQFCKKSLNYNHSVKSLIDSPKAKETQIHLSMNFGIGGHRNETIKLNDFIKLCLKNELTNDKDLYWAIQDIRKQEKENDINEILIKSIINDDYKKVKECLDKGADVNIEDKSVYVSDRNYGFRPLLYAKSLKMNQLLIEYGADINTKDRDGNTALMYATNKKELESAKYLIENGADVNAKNNRNETALMIATMWGDTETTKLLINNGADKTIRNDNNKTALDIAKEYKQSKIVNFLKPKIKAKTKSNDFEMSM